MDTTNKVIIGIDKEVVELQNEEKEAFLLDQQMRILEVESRKAALVAKAEANKIAANKLLALGLTQDDIKALGLDFELEPEIDLPTEA